MEKHEKIFRLVGSNIKTYRKKAKLTQQELANKFSGDRTKISLIENGKENFMFSTLLDIAEGLNVDVKKFFLPIKKD
ncbi:helix-turn-helix domain-containing protein [Pedobacter namyangjuensis]|uniref:helix-turn-helix domain-containing protein n=1 Tax=Pedobacter namyangjuensis TaxID=600626 RepID=UPI000DE20CC1|nr:helix-turn-helix transcriptional regulator [Pedobacter namyangjuensis]